MVNPQQNRVVSPELESSSQLTRLVESESAITKSDSPTDLHRTTQIVHSPPQLPSIEVNPEEWSAETSDLLDALPRLWTRGLLYTLIGCTAVLLPWSILAKVDETGTARGRLEPRERIVHLGAPVGGKIEEMRVQEGDKVEAGQVLVKLESELVNSELEQSKDKQTGQVQRLTQLELLQNQLKVARQTQQQHNQSQQLEKQSQIDLAQQNLNTLQALYQTQRLEKQAQIEQVEQSIEAKNAEVKVAELELARSQEKAKSYQQAFQDGVIAQDNYLDIEQQAQANQERLTQAKSAVEQTKSQLKEQQNSYENLMGQAQSEIEQAKLRLEEQKRSYQSLLHAGKLEQLKMEEQIQDLEAQITALNSEMSQNDKQIAAEQFQLKQRLLTAPAAGTVFHIPVTGAGAVVQPGEKIVEIAPDNSELILRAQIAPTESGFLEVGMPVKVKFDAYPFQDYGIVEGKVTWIAPDSKVTETAQARQETFELKIELDQSYIEDYNQRITLTPGQTATAEIVIRQRRVIDFFLDPFKKLQKSGMKL
jgi:HlyD family secretion protein